QYLVVRVRIVFFFQAEDGIRDRNVTGVQTCALPILTSARTQKQANRAATHAAEAAQQALQHRQEILMLTLLLLLQRRLWNSLARSEERRVGKRVEVGRSCTVKVQQVVNRKDITGSRW